jgi:UDP-N-acetylmuramoyl-L-alanyl-D-glutamate--2,6-diaminopimelate ligase
MPAETGGTNRGRALDELAAELELKNTPDLKGIRVTEIVMDSRQVSEGCLFVAVPGTRVDGHQFIPQAVERGARAVVGTHRAEDYEKLDAVYLQVPESREALAGLAAAWYGHPARKLTVIGVTGTDGKTTTVNLIFSVLKQAGIQAGLISTVKAVIGEYTLDTGFHVTTPEALEVQGYLAQMVEAGLTHVVLEATSHGLAQKRVDGSAFDLGVVTNITHEHLDYHGDYPAYRDAKARLFQLTARSTSKPGRPGKKAVLNQEDQSYPFLRELCAELDLPVISYGTDPGADLQGRLIRQSPQGLVFEIVGEDPQGEFSTPLVGGYNLANCLAAAAACSHGLGIPLGTVREGLQNLPGIPGRMENIDLGQDFWAVVDFAHTPNALRNALTAARQLGAGRVIAVFGSAGLRDRAKRRMMAEISAELADLTVLTAEDPRTEDLDQILEEMAQGMRNKGAREKVDFWRIPDRGHAIRAAVNIAQPDDLVIVCGKGHEQSMCFGETEYPWDDRQAVRAALGELLGVPGPEMPDLPTS